MLLRMGSKVSKDCLLEYGNTGAESRERRKNLLSSFSASTEELFESNVYYW